MQNIALIGSNIAHSWSPALHNRLFREYDLPYEYVLMPLDVEEVAAAMDVVRTSGYRGLNVTSPHKEVAFDLVDERSATVERIGALNTVVIDESGSFGENTDVPGFAWSLQGEPLFDSSFSAAVLGTGGAARAAVEVLLGYPGLETIVVYSRVQENAGETIQRWSDRRLSAAALDQFRPADLVVHATPVGLPGRDGALLGAADLEGAKLLYEMIYASPETALMRAAKEAGAGAMNGRRMFAGQAAEAFRLWTGIAVAPETVLGLLPES